MSHQPSATRDRSTSAVTVVLCLAILAATFTVVSRDVDAITQKNLLTDNQHSFEESKVGWQHQGNTSTSQVTGVAAVGSASLRVLVDQNDSTIDGTRTARIGTRVKRAGVPVSPGTRYDGWMQVLGEDVSSPARCAIRWYRSDGSTLETVAGAYVTEVSGSWTPLSCSATAPSGAVYASLRLEIADASYGDVHYLDDAWFVANGVDATAPTTAAPTTTKPAPTTTTTTAPPTSPPPSGTPTPSAATRGPIGRECPHTPSYRTPATHHATAATLQSVLNSIKVSDSTHPVVIQTTGLPAKLTGGNASWGRNVLIRPPLTSFLPAVAGIDTYAAAVTIGGFHFTSTIRTRDHAYRQWYMRSTLAPAVTVLPTNADQAGLCEVVFATRGMEGDTVQIKGYKGDFPVGYHMLGVWLEGKDRIPNSKAHADTVQYTSCVDCIIEDSVLFGSVFAVIASNEHGPQSGLVIKNTWLDDGEAMSALIKSPGLRLIGNDFVGSVKLNLPDKGGAVEVSGNRFGGSFIRADNSSLKGTWPSNIYGTKTAPPKLDLSSWK